jgi:hypothetical protein
MRGRAINSCFVRKGFDGDVEFLRKALAGLETLGPILEKVFRLTRENKKGT